MNASGNRRNPAKKRRGPKNSDGHQMKRTKNAGARRGNNNNNNNNNGNNNGNNNSNNNGKKRTLENVVKNGEKGARSSAVPETMRINFVQMLKDFRETDEATQPRLQFPSTLTNTERKYIHEQAKKLGLVSKSIGKGDDRKIHVTRTKVNAANSRNVDDDKPAPPQLPINKASIKAIRSFVHAHASDDDSVFPTAGSGSAASATRPTAVSPSAPPTSSPLPPQHYDSLQSALSAMEIDPDVEMGDERTSGSRISMSHAARRKFHEKAQKDKQAHSNYNTMMQQRRTLPAYAHEKHIVEQVQSNLVTIIKGETGCGKSTQIPQFLLDAIPTANIVVTQPRRISAISIAERIADEQFQPKRGGLLAHQVRQDSTVTSKTQLTFLTPGVLIRKLMGSSLLDEYTHVIIDEVHERDKYTEFILIILREILAKRSKIKGKELRVILMSATVQIDIFADYFTTPTSRPKVIKLDGRTFPVQTFFLENMLEMTAFLDTTGPMYKESVSITNQQLDAELAKLLPATPSQKPTPSKGQKRRGKKAADDFGMQCAMCGMSNFGGDIMKYAMHVAICDGTREIQQTIAMVDDADVSTASSDAMDDDDAGDDIMTIDGGGADESKTYEDYADYDVQATVDTSDMRRLMLDAEELKSVLAESMPKQVDEVKFLAPQNTPDDIGQLGSVNREVDGNEATADDGDDNDGENDDDGGDDVIMGSGGEASKTNTGDTPEMQQVVARHKKLLQHYQMVHNDDLVDNDLIVATLKCINEKYPNDDGAVLIFFAGWQDISSLKMVLHSTDPFKNPSKYLILPLHSGISNDEQRKVLRRPPKNVRKIILSTNIAETSLTIDDVSFVIDTGRAKEKSYDPHLKTATLQPMWISQASAKQRRGRAGRTKPGICFHMFSATRHESLREFTESEMVRTPLEELCLMCKKLRIAPGGASDDDGIPALLSKAVTPPHSKSVRNALEMLVELGAMTKERNDLTFLGSCLATLSLEPRVGKMLLLSYLLGCSQVSCDMAAGMSYKSPFIMVPDALKQHAKKVKLKLSRDCRCDQVTMHNILEDVDRISKKPCGGPFVSYCRRNYLSNHSMRTISDVRSNLSKQLKSIGFAAPWEMRATNPVTGSTETAFHNRNKHVAAMWQATLVAGLYPNIAYRKRGNVNFTTISKQKIKIQTGSVNAIPGTGNFDLRKECRIPEDALEIICFGEITQGERGCAATQTTYIVSPLPLLILCGTRLTVEQYPNSETTMMDKPIKPELRGMCVMTLDGWLSFRCPPIVARGIVNIRKRVASGFPKILVDPSLGFGLLDKAERAAVLSLDDIFRNTYDALLKSGGK